MEKRIQIRNTNRCWLQLLFDSFKWRSLSEIHTLQAIIMFCLTYFELSRFQTENGSLSCENNLKVLHFLKFFFLCIYFNNASDVLCLYTTVFFKLWNSNNDISLCVNKKWPDSKCKSFEILHISKGKFYQICFIVSLEMFYSLNSLYSIMY